jgi:hypothetical protein
MIILLFRCLLKVAIKLKKSREEEEEDEGEKRWK